MKKKYILALTFLFVMSSQLSFGQNWSGDFDEYIDEFDVCDPLSSYFNQDFCDYKNGVQLDVIVVDPCDPENVGYDYCRCNPSECDTNDPCVIFSTNYDPTLCDSNDPCDIFSSAYDVDICNGGNSGGSGSGGSGGSSSTVDNIEAIRNYVLNHQSSLLGLATNLKQTGTYVQIGGLTVAAIGLFTTGGAMTAPGISIAIAGGYTEATGVVLQILVEYIVSGNTGEFEQFFISKSIDYGLGLLLPGPNPDMSTLINDAIEIINEAILAAGGNAIPN